MVAVVSFERLDLVHTSRKADGQRKYLKLQIDHDQFGAIRYGVASALGLLPLKNSKPEDL